MTKQGSSDLSLGPKDVLITLENLISSYAHRIKQRLKTMKRTQEKKTAPARYLRMLKEISPWYSNDWRAGDVCFLEHYKKDTRLYQKLLQVREDYFKNNNL